MKTRTFLLAGAAVALLAGATGCSSDPEHDATPTKSASAGPAAARAAFVEVSKCMRANGWPKFPDPVQDSRGSWGFPEAGNAGPRKAPPACDAFVRRAKALTPNQDRKKVTPQDLAQMRVYAKCMREHGVPDWPDPDDEGTFRLPQRLLPERLGKDRLNRMSSACAKYEPTMGIKIVAPGGR